jgi:hypothetical protein
MIFALLLLLCNICNSRGVGPAFCGYVLAYGAKRKQVQPTVPVKNVVLGVLFEDCIT